MHCDTIVLTCAPDSMRPGRVVGGSNLPRVKIFSDLISVFMHNATGWCLWGIHMTDIFHWGLDGMGFSTWLDHPDIMWSGGNPTLVVIHVPSLNSIYRLNGW